MSNEINLGESLSFDGIDRKPPEQVVLEISELIKAQTHNYIEGTVKPYEGHIESYTTTTGGVDFSGLLQAQEKTVDIQRHLGKIGYEEHDFEFYLAASALPKYRFRLMFFSYGIGGYPVKVVLEQGIADEIFQRSNGWYTIECNSKEDLENTVISVIKSKRVLRILQELINASIMQTQGTQKPLTGDGMEKPEEDTKGE